MSLSCSMESCFRIGMLVRVGHVHRKKEGRWSAEGTVGQGSMEQRTEGMYDIIRLASTARAGVS